VVQGFVLVKIRALQLLLFVATLEAALDQVFNLIR
jgi:hypothetical protein